MPEIEGCRKCARCCNGCRLLLFDKVSNLFKCPVYKLKFRSPVYTLTKREVKGLKQLIFSWAGRNSDYYDCGICHNYTCVPTNLDAKDYNIKLEQRIIKMALDNEVWLKENFPDFEEIIEKAVQYTKQLNKP